MEAAWKKQKSKFASARYVAQDTSVLVSAQELEDKELQVQLAMKRFNNQGRKRLLQLCAGGTKKGRALFWKYVSFKSKVSTDMCAML